MAQTSSLLAAKQRGLGRAPCRSGGVLLSWAERAAAARWIDRGMAVVHQAFRKDPCKPAYRRWSMRITPYRENGHRDNKIRQGHNDLTHLVLRAQSPRRNAEAGGPLGEEVGSGPGRRRAADHDETQLVAIFAVGISVRQTRRVDQPGKGKKTPPSNNQWPGEFR